MRIPFLKIDQDALVRGRTMSRLLGLPWYAGIGIANELFAWALDMAPEHNGEVDLSGTIGDEDPAAMIAAAVGWQEAPAKLFAALIRVGFVAPAGAEPARVKGLDRYIDAVPRTADQRSEQASKAAKARWAGHGAQMLSRARVSGSIAPGLLIDAQTQTQTQTQLKALAGGKRPPPPPDPRLSALSRVLEDDYQNIRQSRFAHGGAKDTQALKKLLPIATDTEIRRRWIKGIEGTGWASCSTFAQLASKWNDLAAPSSGFDPNQGIISREAYP